MTPRQTKPPVFGTRNGIVAERTEVIQKLDSLREFIDKPAAFLLCSEEEQKRLRRQRHYMTLYAMVLTERIAAL